MLRKISTFLNPVYIQLRGFLLFFVSILSWPASDLLLILYEDSKNFGKQLITNISII